MKYAFIEAEAGNHAVTTLCRVIRVSRSGYYGWRGRGESRRAVDDRRLLDHIRALHRKSWQAYGAFNIRRGLGDAGRRRR